MNIGTTCVLPDTVVVSTGNELSDATKRSKLIIEAPPHIAVVTGHNKVLSTIAAVLVENSNFPWRNSNRGGLVIEHATHVRVRPGVRATGTDIIRVLVESDPRMSLRKQHEQDSDD